jgi:phosphatidylserine decarboxylase
MTAKQGAKFDAPESVAEIPRFIAFHQLDMDEVLDPIDSFRRYLAMWFLRD